MPRTRFDIKNIVLEPTDDPERFFLMDKDVIISKDCIALPVEELGSPQYRLFSALVKNAMSGTEGKKYLLYGANRQFYAVKVNNNDEFLFEEITPNNDIDGSGKMSIRLVLEKGKEMILETDGSIFAYRGNDGLERKYFESVDRDIHGNTEFSFNGRDYRMTKEESNKGKSFLSSILSIFK